MPRKHQGRSYRLLKMRPSIQAFHHRKSMLLLSFSKVFEILTQVYRIAFYFPMLAVINLFVYILKNPTFTTVQSDLAHLDLAAGHFAKIHFLTSSQVSFTFPREIVGLASEAIRMSSFQTAGYTAQSLPVDISPEVRIWPLVSLHFVLAKAYHIFRLAFGLRPDRWL